jgi:hypothetical protein
VSEELLALFEDVKLRHKHKYFIFSLAQTGKVGTKATFGWSIDAKAEPVADDKNKSAFEEMMGQLPADDARFVVFDFTDTKPDGRQIKKLVLIKWCPDSVSFRIKPVVGASYQVRAGAAGLRAGGCGTASWAPPAHTSACVRFAACHACARATPCVPAGHLVTSRRPVPSALSPPLPPSPPLPSSSGRRSRRS